MAFDGDLNEYSNDKDPHSGTASIQSDSSSDMFTFYEDDSSESTSGFTNDTFANFVSVVNGMKVNYHEDEEKSSYPAKSINEMNVEQNLADDKSCEIVGNCQVGSAPSVIVTEESISEESVEVIAESPCFFTVLSCLSPTNDGKHEGDQIDQISIHENHDARHEGEDDDRTSVSCKSSVDMDEDTKENHAVHDSFHKNIDGRHESLQDDTMTATQAYLQIFSKEHPGPLSPERQIINEENDGKLTRIQNLLTKCKPSVSLQLPSMGQKLAKNVRGLGSKVRSETPRYHVQSPRNGSVIQRIKPRPILTYTDPDPEPPVELPKRHQLGYTYYTTYESKNSRAMFLTTKQHDKKTRVPQTSTKRSKRYQVRATTLKSSDKTPR